MQAVVKESVKVRLKIAKKETVDKNFFARSARESTQRVN